MENKQKVFIYALFFLTTLSIKCTEGAFIGQQTITDGLFTPHEPNYPFYHNNLLHLLIGVNYAHTGAEALLAQYNSGGTIVRKVSFPLPCLQECTIEGALFGLVNNSAFFSLRRSEPRNQWACMIYQVDLSSFQIINSSNILNGTNSYYCTYSLPTWTPYNSTHSIFNSQWFVYETLSLISNDPVMVYTYNNIGGSSTALSNENLIIYQERDGYNQFFVAQDIETNNEEIIPIPDGSMMVFLGDNSTNVAITNYFYEGYNISLLDAANPLKTPNSQVFVQRISQSGMLADSSNNLFFIGNSFDFNDSVVILQYNVNVTSNTHILLDKIIIDNYFTAQFYPALFSVLSWGLNEATQQFAIATTEVANNNYRLQLIDYDNSPGVLGYQF